MLKTKMNLKEKVRYILRKHPEGKYERGKFFWYYLEEFYGVHIFVLKKQFLEFMKEFAGLERTLRDVLKEDEFKLPPENDAKRYEKANKFREEYKRKEEYKKFKDSLTPEERKEYNYLFDEND